MTIWITSGDRPSNGRLYLQQAGGFKKVKTSSSFKLEDTLINWGCGSLGFHGNGQMYGIKILNISGSVGAAANKLSAFKEFQVSDVPTVSWTTNKTVVAEWLEKSDVVVRNKLTGHSGEGIVIIEKGATGIPDAPLYTKYVYKTHEYRIHVVGSEVIDVQRKIRDPSRTPVTWKVRSHANGFIYVRDGVEVSQAVKDVAIAAILACGLDFGAVDIITDKSGGIFVLEINTAPGLEGKTVESYVTALKKLCNGS